MWTEIFFFLLRYKAIILFYLLIIAFIIIKRKQLDVQAKIIILYRTKWGLRWMDRTVQRWKEWIVLFGYIGVGIGFVGMIFISYTLIKNLIDLMMMPGTTSGVSLVLPGIDVPGVGILPFWHWLVAIFLIAVVHEFSHGIVARAHKLEVKNTGIVFFGPIIGAFVEPNEEKMRKEKEVVQYSVLAAGSFSNIILAIVALLLMSLLFVPIQQTMVEPTGFTFQSYVDSTYPFAQAAIAPGTLITGINNIPTLRFEDFSSELAAKKPGDTIIVHAKEKDYEITLAQNPDDAKKPFLGIQAIKNEFEVKGQYTSGVSKALYTAIVTGVTFLRWLFLLSLGIGLFNLLPLPIVDGGRMMQTFLYRLKGEEKGEKRYRQIGVFFLVVLLLSLFFPLLIKLF